MKSGEAPTSTAPARCVTSDFERRVKVALVAGARDDKLLAHRLRRGVYTSQSSAASGRLTSINAPMTPAADIISRRRSNTLGIEFDGQQGDAGNVAAGPVQAFDQPSGHRVGSRRVNTIGIVAVAALAASGDTLPPLATITATLVSNQFGRHRGQPVVADPRPNDIRSRHFFLRQSPALARPRQNDGRTDPIVSRDWLPEKSNYRHRLLCECSERPSRRRTACQLDEVPPPHARAEHVLSNRSSLTLCDPAASVKSGVKIGLKRWAGPMSALGQKPGMARRFFPQAVTASAYRFGANSGLKPLDRALHRSLGAKGQKSIGLVSNPTAPWATARRLVSSSP